MIHDCLASNVLENHQKALKEMIFAMGAQVTSASVLISLLEGTVEDDDSSTRGLYHAGTWLEENGATSKELQSWVNSLTGDDDDDVGQANDPQMNELGAAMASTSLSRPQTGDASNGARRQLSTMNLRTSQSSRDIRESGQNRLRVRKRAPAVPPLPSSPKSHHTNGSHGSVENQILDRPRNSQASERSRLSAQEGTR